MFNNKVYASDKGAAIEIPAIDNLLWSVIKTIQFYTIPLMTLAIVVIGIRLLLSGEDTQVKEQSKNWIIRILIGGTLIFGATTIASLIKTAITI